MRAGRSGDRATGRAGRRTPTLRARAGLRRGHLAGRCGAVVDGQTLLEDVEVGVHGRSPATVAFDLFGRMEQTEHRHEVLEAVTDRHRITSGSSG